MENQLVLDITWIVQVTACQSDGSSVYPNNDVLTRCDYQPFGVWGSDFAVAAANPVAQLTQSVSLQMNNVSTTMQSPVIRDLTHVMSGPSQNATRGTTSKIPIACDWNVVDGTPQGLGSQAEMSESGQVPPGAFDVVFVAPKPGSSADGDNWAALNGTEGAFTWGVHPSSWPGAQSEFNDLMNTMWDPPAGQTYQVVLPSGATLTVPFYAGQPLTSPANVGQNVVMWVRFRTSDPLFTPPLGYNSQDALQRPGIWGLASAGISMQLTDAATARWIQSCSNSGFCLLPGAAGQKIMRVLNATCWQKYLTPSLEQDLPAECAVPLAQTQFYQQTSTPIPQVQGFTGQPMPLQTITLNTVTFSQVPDSIIISGRPIFSCQMPTETDYCVAFPDRAITNFNFCNMVGPFGSSSARDLFEQTLKNGGGQTLQGMGGATGTGYFMLNGTRQNCASGPLIFRPADDFILPPGTSVGSTGQCQFTASFQYYVPGVFNNWEGPGDPPANSSPRTIVWTITAISTGYFLTNNGNSRIFLVGLNDQMVLGAPAGPDRYQARRLMGGGFLDSLSSFGQQILPLIGPIADVASHFMGGGEAGSGMAGAGFHSGGVGLSGAKRARIATGTGNFADRLSRMGH
jgi:hypothetical protein